MILRDGERERYLVGALEACNLSNSHALHHVFPHMQFEFPANKQLKGARAQCPAVVYHTVLKVVLIQHSIYVQPQSSEVK